MVKLLFVLLFLIQTQAFALSELDMAARDIAKGIDLDQLKKMYPSLVFQRPTVRPIGPGGDDDDDDNPFPNPNDLVSSMTCRDDCHTVSTERCVNVWGNDNETKVKVCTLKTERVCHRICSDDGANARSFFK